MKSFKSFLLGAVVLAAATAVFAQAQDAEGGSSNAGLQLSEAGTYGQHLVTADGRAVYLFMRDNRGESVCYGRCAVNYPPLLEEEGLTFGEGVNEALVGTTVRADGTVQMTYAGHPLYTHNRDTEAGMIRGQGRGAEIWLVSAGGARIMHPAPVAEADAEAAEPAGEEEVAAQDEFQATGQQIYNSVCFACHGNEGEGGAGPRLAGQTHLATDGLVRDMVIFGFPDHGMPAFGPQYNDFEIAAVSTYVMNAWGNNYGRVTPEEVAAARR